MYHDITLAGRMGGEPTRRVESAPVTFSVAVDKTVKGEKTTLWFRVTAWEKTGDFIEQYGRKGARVIVRGTLQAEPDGGPRVWDNGNGPRASFEVTAYELKLIDWPDKDEDTGPRFDNSSATYVPAESDESIPF